MVSRCIETPLLAENVPNLLNWLSLADVSFYLGLVMFPVLLRHSVRSTAGGTFVRVEAIDVTQPAACGVKKMKKCTPPLKN